MSTTDPGRRPASEPDARRRRGAGWRCTGRSSAPRVRGAGLPAVHGGPGQGHLAPVAGHGGHRRRLRRGDAPDDYTFCTYRGHATRWRAGTPMAGVMGELLGRANGVCGGKGGSMHLTSVEHGVMGSYAIIGAHLPIANGAAWSAQVRGSGQVAVCFFGTAPPTSGLPRGAQPRQGLEPAGRVRVREQPLHGVHADRRRHRRRAPGRRPRVRLRARVDHRRRQRPRRGVRRRTTAIERARAGGGPSLIEAKTYRHGGHSRADPGDYRPRRRSPPGSSATRCRPTGAAARRRVDEADARRDRGRGAGGRRRATEAAKAAPPPTCRRPTPTSGRTEARRGGTDHLPGRRRAGSPRRCAATRRCTSSARTSPPPAGSSRPPRACSRSSARAGARHADLRGGDPRRGHGRGDDRPAPVAEIMFSDFLATCWDLVAVEIPKARYMTDGQVTCRW
jgi:acetoin:2,6-dichlorophenolindophenol oxidoreductase subunit alpha